MSSNVYLSKLIFCFIFLEFVDLVSSLFLFWLLVVLGLGGGDVPLVVWVSLCSTVTVFCSGEGFPLVEADGLTSVAFSLTFTRTTDS